MADSSLVKKKLQVVDKDKNKVVKDIRNPKLPVNVVLDTTIKGSFVKDTDTTIENQSKRNLKVPLGNGNKPILSVEVGNDGLIITKIEFTVNTNFPVANNIFFEVWHGKYEKKIITPAKKGNVFYATDYFYDTLTQTPQNWTPHVLVKVLDHKHNIISTAVSRSRKRQEIINFCNYVYDDVGQEVVFMFPIGLDGQEVEIHTTTNERVLGMFGNGNIANSSSLDRTFNLVMRRKLVQGKVVFPLPDVKVLALVCFYRK